MRLQFGDPVCQLHHLEELVFILQVRRPNPKRVGDQTSEPAQRNRRESQHGRRTFRQRGRA
jgi:hypothetical protein